MKPKKKKFKSEEDLKFDNEFRKIKLQMEKEATFHSSKNIPPELENIFLNQIEEFDKAFNKSRQISVFEKSGKPTFKKMNEISEEDIKKELNALHKKLAGKGIKVGSICGVEDKEMYRFITEEIFPHTIDDIALPGMMCHYTYEEFHPNHEYDVKERTKDFVKFILSDTRKMDEWFFAEHIKTSLGKSVKKEEVLEKINLFCSFYSKFEIEKFEILGLKINEKKTLAEILFNLDYTGTIDGSSEEQTFSGKGKAMLEYECEWWSIYQFSMPGFVI